MPSVTYAELVESCLCFGWIDGRSNRLDDRFYLQRITPRRARSVWSQKNVDAVEALTLAGRMRPAGLAAVEAARADGRWERAYAGSATITVPDDLAAALAAEPAAQQEFEALDGANRYAVLWRVHTAASRRRRGPSGSPALVQMLAEGRRRTDRAGTRSGSAEADAEPEAALVDAGDGDRRAVGAGVHHHPVADVEADVADRRVEEDEVAGLQLARATPGCRAGTAPGWSAAARCPAAA